VRQAGETEEDTSEHVDDTSSGTANGLWLCLSRIYS
jgi:hypothetical protein